MTEELLDRAQVGARVEQVRGERVPQRVGAHAPRDPRGRGAPPYDRVDRPRRQPAAPMVREERAAGRRAVCEVRLERARRRGTEGHDPLLPALTEDPHRPPGAVHGVECEGRELRDAQAAGVEQLENGEVARARRPPERLALDERCRLVDRQEGDELLREPRASHLPGRVPLERAAADEEAEPAPERGELAPHGGRLEAPRVKVREIATHRPRVDGVERLPRPHKPLELREVAPVAPERVGRRVPLEREVAQERRPRIVHATVVSTSRSKSQASRAHRRSTRPRAARSVVNGAPHFGQGSGTGRCQTTNRQAG